MDADVELKYPIFKNRQCFCVPGLVSKIRPGQSSSAEIRCECTGFVHTYDGLHNVRCARWFSIRQVEMLFD